MHVLVACEEVQHVGGRHPRAPAQLLQPPVEGGLVSSPPDPGRGAQHRAQEQDPPPPGRRLTRGVPHRHVVMNLGLQLKEGNWNLLLIYQD